MRILTFTTLYPSSAQPRNGIFVEQRLRHLLESGRVESKVVAPVPWFPSAMKQFGKYAKFAAAPTREHRFGIEVLHPRFPVIPKVGMSLAPSLLYTFVKPVLRQVMERDYKFDLIDAHYFYPDGVAAAWLGRLLNKPVCITARGTDINLIPKFRIPRKLIQNAANSVSAIITVCQALKDSIVDMGVPENKITVLRNGVDLELFYPLEREQSRKELGINKTTLLSVGYLIERKGHHIAIEALAELDDVHLIIIGDGELESQLKQLAQKKGVAHRVRFEGAVPQEKLKTYYSAVDALVLASSREGMANVMLESIACGNPVIATNCWGAPEVIATSEAGVLMKERSTNALVVAYRQLMEDYPDRRLTRNYAEHFSWEATTQGQIRLFNQVLENFRYGD